MDARFSDHPPVADENQLHFFPGRKALILYVVRPSARTVLLRVEAHGGPRVPATDPRMREMPTTAGAFVIERVESYRTPTWPTSQIKWGTPLRDVPQLNDVQYQLRPGVFGSVSRDLRISRDEIRREYFALYGLYRVPPTWIFNDFGPLAIRYFKDLNANRRLDGSERLSGEMIHTTPVNEAQTSRGDEVKLESSHGCIHIKPVDRDKLIGMGAFKKGTRLIVHSYQASP